jgi:hypothetical protein
VGGIGVSVGTGVADGGTGVLVGVSIGVSVGTGVADGGTGVMVGVSVSLATGAKVAGDLGVSSSGTTLAGTALRDAADPSEGSRPVNTA